MPAIQTDTSGLHQSLKLMDFHVFQAMQRATAPPFIGVLNVSDKMREMAGPAIKSAIGGNQADAVRVLQKIQTLGSLVFV